MPIRLGCTLLLSLIGSGPAHALSLSVGCGDGLTATAVIDPTYKAFSAGKESISRLEAKLKVVNAGTTPAQYSNRFLRLNGARAYVDSPASHVVDSATVTVGPGAVLELSVYWPSSGKPGTNTRQLAFECKAAGP